MEFIYATVLGLGIGAVVRYLIPGRSTHGLLLLPGVGMIAAAALWAGATWIGWKPGGTWIWVVSLVGAALVSAAVALIAWRARIRIDERRFQQLSRASA